MLKLSFLLCSYYTQFFAKGNGGLKFFPVIIPNWICVTAQKEKGRRRGLLSPSLMLTGFLRTPNHLYAWLSFPPAPIVFRASRSVPAFS